MWKKKLLLAWHLKISVGSCVASSSRCIHRFAMQGTNGASVMKTRVLMRGAEKLFSPFVLFESGSNFSSFFTLFRPNVDDD